MLSDDTFRDDIGKTIKGQNPIKNKNSSIQDRDAYMNCDQVSYEHIEEWQK